MASDSTPSHGAPLASASTPSHGAPSHGVVPGVGFEPTRAVFGSRGFKPLASTVPPPRQGGRTVHILTQVGPRIYSPAEARWVDV